VCLRPIDAAYVAANGDGGGADIGDARADVLLVKTCPDHGDFSAPAWRWPGVEGIPFVDWSRGKSPSPVPFPSRTTGKGCPYDCGLCPSHAQHTCLGLVEVTRRCDLGCPLCYASARNADAPPDPALDEIRETLTRLRKLAGPCNVQISGGEPTMRDDLPEIVECARKLGFGLLQVNTNGLRFAREPGYAATLRHAGLDGLYLQWDGVDDDVFTHLRGRPLLAEKRACIAAATEAGLGTVLVATVVGGINHGQLGDLLRLSLSLGTGVRGLHLQPAAFFGRYPYALEEAPRLTLSEVMGELARQAPELVRLAEFHPPGCEHALCSFSAVYAREGGNLRHIGQAECCPPAPPGPLPTAAEGARASKAFVAAHWKGGESGGKESGTGGGTAAKDDFGRFLRQVGEGRRFTLSGMAFQDALSLDLDRTRGCCVHVARPDGRLVPFCLHNLTSRDGHLLHPR
jgi:uncharacterized radical SAM superfamily Fe-S cluster-containing enzyme